uniref:Beta-carotene isomerase D27-like C-terminal domain-containing protein n=1 Tax=Glycine max TaxID=3847 RepID=A0A0R0HMS5_SOYBN
MGTVGEKMKALGAVGGGGAPVPVVCSSVRNHRFRVSFSSSSPSPGPKTVEQVGIGALKSDYKPGVFDDLFLKLFRNKLVQVRILRSLFPPYLLELYKMLIAPIGGGKIAAMMVARVTVLTCQWLMGPCKVNSVDLPDGTSCSSGVYVERCKYLEESKCVGICTHTCKFPTQTFFKDHMGVPLLMEPNFADYSCQFKFGVLPPRDDTIVKEPCLEACPNAKQRRMVARNIDITACPKT